MNSKSHEEPGVENGVKCRKDDVTVSGGLAQSIKQIREGLLGLENWSQGFNDLTAIPARWVIHRCEAGVFLLDMESMIDRAIRKTDSWESAQIKTLTRLIKQHYSTNYDLVFLDIGAYLGWYSMVMLRSGLFSELHAFEANPENYAQLNANILLNSALKSIHLHPNVVTDRTGETQISLPLRRSNRGWAEVSETAGFNADFHVPNLVLDQLFAGVSDKFFVAKIDVEGHEEHVLEGMRKLFESNMFLLQVEAYSRNEKRIHEKLKGAGFEFIESIREDHFFFKAQA
ncbi:MAG TPA: FkbM family methyltransferase [Anaerolineales bacterium]|nr:FkbM family methyltransferase [Anaerolineales bacterium]